MNIQIKIEGEDKEETLSFSDENMNNDNFVEMTLEDREYSIGVDDLEAVIQAFRNVRSLRVEREKGYET